MTAQTSERVGTLGIPGYVPGTWQIDAAHSDVSFRVRHLMVSKVRGRFGQFAGTIVTAPDPLQSSAEVSIDLASIDTGEDKRDEHLRSPDFFETAKYPTMTYRTTGVRAEGDHFVFDGELTLKGVTRPVALEVELGGIGPDAWGGTRLGFSATAEINRKDFGVDFDARIADGGLVVADKVEIVLEIEAVLQG
jgi:polyisoprenoid-binding protein YceI